MSEPSVDLPRPAALIFDLDGTLVDTVETRIRAWLAVFEEETIPADRRQVAELIGLDGRQLAREVATAAGIDLEAGRDEAIDARCGKIFAGLNRDPRPLPGVGELVSRMEAVGIPWAIATSSRREQLAASVGALGLASAPLIVDGTHVEHAKPAPDLLLLAAHELRAEASHCWYDGDPAGLRTHAKLLDEPQIERSRGRGHGDLPRGIDQQGHHRGGRRRCPLCRGRGPGDRLAPRPRPRALN